MESSKIGKTLDFTVENEATLQKNSLKPGGRPSLGDAPANEDSFHKRIRHFLRWIEGNPERLNLEWVVKARLGLYLSALNSKFITVVYRAGDGALKGGADRVRGVMSQSSEGDVFLTLETRSGTKIDSPEARYVLAKLIVHALAHRGERQEFIETDRPPVLEPPIPRLDHETLLGALSLLLPRKAIALEIEKAARTWGFDSAILLLNNKKSKWLWENRILWTLQHELRSPFNILLIRLWQTGFLCPGTLEDFEPGAATMSFV